MLDRLIDNLLAKSSPSSTITSYWSGDGFDLGYCGTEVWWSSDTEHNFYNNGNKVDYTSHSIQYHLSNHNAHAKARFRLFDKESQSVVTDKTIACFGCSQTFGVGLQTDQTWPYILKNLLHDEYDVVNFGIAGASSDIISRLVNNYLIQHTPKVVCCLLPDIFRRELFSGTNNDAAPQQFFLQAEENVTMLDICKRSGFDVKDYKCYKHFSGEDNALYQYYKNIRFIEALCKSKGVQVYTLSWTPYVLSLNSNGVFTPESFVYSNDEKYRYLLDWHNMQKARDNVHLGEFSSTLYAELFYNSIKKI